MWAGIRCTFSLRYPSPPISVKKCFTFNSLARVFRCNLLIQMELFAEYREQRGYRHLQRLLAFSFRLVARHFILEPSGCERP